MSVEPTELLSAAMALPDDQRAGLAYKLLQSLKPPGVPSDADRALEAELDRRVTAYETGETTADDWQNVSERLRRALDEGEAS